MWAGGQPARAIVFRLEGVVKVGFVHGVVSFTGTEAWCIIVSCYFCRGVLQLPASLFIYTRGGVVAWVMTVLGTLLK